MQKVLVVGKDREPLMPCQPARARKLLKVGKAAVLRHQPFTIILTERKGGDTQELSVKVDPGYGITGIVMVARYKSGKEVVWAAELHHRGEQIRRALYVRKTRRFHRRSRKTRYRRARFANRHRSEGWLPPSLQSRVDNIGTWINRLQRYAPVGSLALELAKFDTQRLRNPEVDGVEYQRGELYRCELREYLMEKWGGKCAYCGTRGVSLEREHIIPRSRGGSDRVSNFTISCRKCNEDKGNLTAAEFGHPEVQARVGQSLGNVAAMNATRWSLYRRLQRGELPVEVGTGGRTQHNRSSGGYPKKHWVDAACVGRSASEEPVVLNSKMEPLSIRATGRGRRQRCRTNRYGFPIRYIPRRKSYRGFRTGDIVRAEIPAGKRKGKHVGHVTIRFRPLFGLRGFEVHPKHLTLLHRSDGYRYE